MKRNKHLLVAFGGPSRLLRAFALVTRQRFMVLLPALLRPVVLVGSALLMISGAAIVAPAPAWADNDEHRARETGPEDGFLCCNALVPFLFHGDEVLTTTGRAGIFRSEHRGEKWRRSMQGLVGSNGVSPFVAHVSQAPSHPNVVYAVAGRGQVFSPFDGLFSSDDFGETWTRRGQVNTGNGFNACAVDAADPHTVYVSGFDSSDFSPKTWKSTDGGQTVQAFGANLPACAAGGRLHTVRGILYISSSRNSSDNCVAASTDGGVNFHLLPVPPGFDGGFAASPDGRAIFVITRDASFNAAVFRSTDGGTSYVAVNGLPLNFNFLSISFDPTNPLRIYANDTQLLHVSHDGGLTFEPLPASDDPRFFGADQRFIRIDVDPRGSVFLSTRAGPFRTDDGGLTFRSVGDGFRASAVQDLAFDADGKLLVGVQNTQVVFRQMHGRTFHPIGNTPLIDLNRFVYGTASVAGSPTDPNVVLVADGFGNGLLRTDNGGRSWTSATVAGNPSAFQSSRMTFVTDSRVYLVSGFSQPGLYRSDDAGQSFAHLSNLPFGAIAVDPTNPDVVYVGTFRNSTGLFKSTDGGQTLQHLGQAGDFSALAVDRRNPQVIYAGLRSGQVMRSRDGGRTFAPASSGLAGAGVHGLAQDARGTLFVWLGGGGLFASRDGASSWYPVDTGEALQRSGVEAGRGSLVVHPRHPGRVYLGNAGVIQINAGDDEDDTNDDN